MPGPASYQGRMSDIVGGTPVVRLQDAPPGHGLSLNRYRPYLLSDDEQARSDALLASVYERAPRMRQYGFKTKDSRDKYAVLPGGEESRHGRLEFYAPDETGPPGGNHGNPYPGHPTVELFKPLTDYNEDVTQSILGDMLHHLPAVDPEFAAFRQEFRSTITDEQKEVDKRA